jgi:uncharacterized protein (TIGR02588 family)
MTRAARGRADSADPTGGGARRGQSRREPTRSLAEWTTLGISAAIVLALLGLVTYQAMTRGGRPAVIAVALQTEAVRHEGAAYYLPVEIANHGDQTAADVRVQVSLTAGDGRQTAHLSVAFLAGGATARGTAVFRAVRRRGVG